MSPFQNISLIVLAISILQLLTPANAYDRVLVSEEDGEAGKRLLDYEASVLYKCSKIEGVRDAKVDGIVELTLNPKGQIVSLKFDGASLSDTYKKALQAGFERQAFGEIPRLTAGSLKLTFRFSEIAKIGYRLGSVELRGSGSHPLSISSLDCSDTNFSLPVEAIKSKPYSSSDRKFDCELVAIYSARNKLFAAHRAVKAKENGLSTLPPILSISGVAATDIDGKESEKIPDLLSGLAAQHDEADRRRIIERLERLVDEVPCSFSVDWRNNGSNASSIIEKMVLAANILRYENFEKQVFDDPIVESLAKQAYKLSLKTSAVISGDALDLTVKLMNGAGKYSQVAQLYKDRLKYIHYSINDKEETDEYDLDGYARALRASGKARLVLKAEERIPKTNFRTSQSMRLASQRDLLELQANPHPHVSSLIRARFALLSNLLNDADEMEVKVQLVKIKDDLERLPNDFQFFRVFDVRDKTKVLDILSFANSHPDLQSLVQSIITTLEFRLHGGVPTISTTVSQKSLSNPWGIRLYQSLSTATLERCKFENQLKSLTDELSLVESRRTFDEAANLQKQIIQLSNFQLASNEPVSIAAHLKLALLQLKAGQVSAAKQVFSRTVGTIDVKSRSGLTDLAGDCLEKLAFDFTRRKMFSEAEQCARMASKLDARLRRPFFSAILDRPDPAITGLVEAYEKEGLFTKALDLQRFYWSQSDRNVDILNPRSLPGNSALVFDKLMRLMLQVAQIQPKEKTFLLRESEQLFHSLIQQYEKFPGIKSISAQKIIAARIKMLKEFGFDGNAKKLEQLLRQ